MTYKNSTSLSLHLYQTRRLVVELPHGRIPQLNYKDRGRNKLKMDYYIPAGTPRAQCRWKRPTNNKANMGAYLHPTNTANNNYGGTLKYQKQTTYVENLVCVNNSFR